MRVAKSTTIAVIALFVCAAGTAQAGIFGPQITGVTATSNKAPDDANAPVANLVNNSGMSGAYPYQDVGVTYWRQVVAGGVNAQVTFDLGFLPPPFHYNVKAIKIWNYLEPGEMDRGVKNITLWSSTDGTNYTQIGSTYTLTQNSNYGGDPSGISDLIPLGGVNARYIRLDVLSNYGDPTWYGLGEVRFFGVDPVPEPDTLGTTWAGESDGSSRAMLPLKLERGICIDRQLDSIPPESRKTISRDDIRLIGSMGFEFVKVIFNPAVLKAEDGLDASHMWYVDEVVNRVVQEKLPVVVCIHPEPDFKNSVLGNADEFSRFVSFMEALSRYMASRWGPEQLVFQLMTEPFGSSANPKDWNHWDRLQRRVWTAVRSGMPEHTLILSGDMAGSIDGLSNIRPVNDENVLYSFTFYEPLLFTQQGTGEKSSSVHYLKSLSYPSGPETLTELPKILGSVPPEWQSDIRARVKQYAAERWDLNKLAARIEKLAEWRRLHGDHVKLWCAEFGCYQAARPADRCRYVGEVRNLFEQQGIGWCYWSYNEAFSVLTSDRTPYGPANVQTPDQAILQSLFPDKNVRE